MSVQRQTSTVSQSGVPQPSGQLQRRCCPVKRHLCKQRKPKAHYLREVWRDETGSTTVLAALIVAMLAVIGLMGVQSAMALVQQRQSAVAADLTAVAGAIAAQAGEKACEEARSIAKANEAELEKCEIDGEDVLVSVEKHGRQATARAGPAETIPAETIPAG